MTLVLIRVDDRLIHGQVAVGWSRSYNVNRIIVANDSVAKDETQKMLLKMACPVGVEASILTIKEATTQILQNKFRKEKVMMLVKDPGSLIKLIEGGIDIKEVNVGNVSIKEGRKKIVKEIAATPEEVKEWKKLDELNLKLRVQWLPGSSSKNFNNIIRKE